jgi:transposase
MESEVTVGSSVRRRLWTAAEKRQIVEQTLSSDLSVALVARQHGVNANQVFYWRKLYRAGQLGDNEQKQQPEGVRLLPVSVSGEEPSPAGLKQSTEARPGVAINIEIPGRALVSVEGAVDAAIVRAVVESLRG